MAAKALASIGWAIVAVCGITAGVAAVLYGNTNPSGTAEFNCALGATEYCRQIQEAAQLHQLAFGLLVLSGIIGGVFLLDAVVATIVALNEQSDEMPRMRGYSRYQAPPMSPPVTPAPTARAQSSTQPSEHLHPGLWVAMGFGGTLALGIVAYVITRLIVMLR